MRTGDMDSAFVDNTSSAEKHRASYIATAESIHSSQESSVLGITYYISYLPDFKIVLVE